MVFTNEIMDPLFWLLEECIGVTQKEEHHPEGDVFVHSIQVLNIAFRESIDTDLILAAMLHDVGKVGNSLGHEKIACELLDCHCSAKTLWLIENHMRFWYYILGDMKKKSKLESITGHPWLPELVSLARWDKIGRKPFYTISYDRENIMHRLNQLIEEKFNRNENRHRLGTKSMTGFKGVTLYENGLKYKAQIYNEGRNIYLGVSEDPIECAKMYDEAALKLHGAKAITNKMLGLI